MWFISLARDAGEKLSLALPRIVRPRTYHLRAHTLSPQAKLRGSVRFWRVGRPGASSPRIFGSSCTLRSLHAVYFRGPPAFTSVCACTAPLNATVWRRCALFVQREMFIRRNAKDNRVKVYNVDAIHAASFRLSSRYVFQVFRCEKPFFARNEKTAVH